jgi:hypothetical protein
MHRLAVVLLLMLMLLLLHFLPLLLPFAASCLPSVLL